MQANIRNYFLKYPDEPWISLGQIPVSYNENKISYNEKKISYNEIRICYNENKSGYSGIPCNS